MYYTSLEHDEKLRREEWFHRERARLKGQLRDVERQVVGLKAQLQDIFTALIMSGVYGTVFFRADFIDLEGNRTEHSHGVTIGSPGPDA